MESASSESFINWSQLTELVGDPADLDQQAALGEIWRDVRGDLAAEWKRVDDAGDDAETGRQLHRLRGFIATWGMQGLAGALHAVEHGVAPASTWRARRDELALLRDRSVAGIEARYPGLAGGAD